jgi:hypothetical protein
MGTFLFMLLYVLLLALNIWLFLVWPRKDLSERVTTVLNIVGVYTFSLGVLGQLGVLPAFESMGRDLTSPDLFRFLRANFQLASIGFGGLSLALDPFKTAFTASKMVDIVNLLFLAPLALVGFVAYLIFVLPWTYLAYVFVSIPVEAVLTSGRDFCITMSGPTQGESTYCIKHAVQANTFAFRNFLVGVPAVALAFGLNVLRTLQLMLMERVPGQRFKPAETPIFRRGAKYGLWAVQGFIALILVLSAILGLGSLPVIEAEPGEIFGASIALLTILCVEFLFFRKLGVWRKGMESGRA